MKIHFIHSQFSNRFVLDEVLSLIQEMLYPAEFPLEFVNIQANYFYRLQALDNKVDQRTGLAQQAFVECNCYREDNQIPNNDVVIILSECTQSLLWDECTDYKGNFLVSIRNMTFEIDGKYNEYEIQFALIHRIIACAIEYLMQLDPRNETHQSLYFHQNPISCVNDLTRYTSGPQLYEKGGAVCPECTNRLKAMGVDLKEIIKPIQEVLMKNYFKLVAASGKKDEELSSIVFNQKSKNLYLEDNGKRLTVNSFAFSTAIYVFFMKHPKGLNLFQLQEKHLSELFEVYKAVSVTHELDTLRNSIDNLFTTKHAFTKEIGKINKGLTKILGLSVAKNYHLANYKGVYKINLPKSKFIFIDE